MAEDTNGNGGGVRISMQMMYGEVQRLNTSVRDLKEEVHIQSTTMAAILADNVRKDSRLEKLETRMNGVLIGVLSAAIVAGGFFAKGGFG